MVSKKFKRQDKLIQTSEEWYPTVSSQVRVSFLCLDDKTAPLQWRVCVWGGDDFGMEIDFPGGEKIRAQRIYNSLVDFTTQAQMKALGLERA